MTTRGFSADRSLANVNPELAKEWHPTRNGPLTPDQVTFGTNTTVWWCCAKGHEWEARVANRNNGRSCPVCSNRLVLAGYNDLATTQPDIAAEWHPTKNGDIRASGIVAGNNKPAWWQCPLGHEWQASPNSRTSQGTGCPVCANQKLLVGFNDLATTYPELATEWHPTKNLPATPLSIIGGKAKIWWVCDKGHEWQAAADSRKSGTGCPTCSNNVLEIGFNDLSTTHPELAKDWHPTRNGALTPEQVIGGGKKKYWWVCDQGHEYQMHIASRKSGMQCAVCSNRQVQIGVNDLATTHPEIAAQWHPIKNLPVTPDQIVDGGHRRYWWICSSEHEWQISVSARLRGSGCPICSNHQLLVAFNDLATTHPEIAKQWHPTKNGDLTSSQVLAGTGRKIWWQDAKGHEWQATGNARITSNSGCPFCAGTAVTTGENDFETIFPELAKTWHSTKNGALTPDTISSRSERLVWWVCGNGHDFQNTPARRALGLGCSYCSNQKVLTGYNDIATTHPELSAQWHPTKNLPATPNKTIAGSNKRFWWVCEKGHEWSAIANSRLRGSGCPSCAQSGYDQSKAGLFYFIENQKLGARKIGITNVDIRTDRLNAWNQRGWRTVKTYRGDGFTILTLETLVLRWVRKDLGLPPYLGQSEVGGIGGWSETFSGEGPSNFEIIIKIDELLALIMES
jgi:hypothetical protein